MNQPKIWLSSPHMGGGEEKFVQEAFSSNWIAPLGPNVTGFESDISQYLNPDKKWETAVLVSGTAAIHLALRYWILDQVIMYWYKVLHFAELPIL